MKLHYFLGLLVLFISSSTMHAQEAQSTKQKHKTTLLVLKYPHKLVQAENKRHAFDLIVARNSRASSASSQSSTSSSSPSPQQSPSTSPREEGKKLEAVSE